MDAVRQFIDHADTVDSVLLVAAHFNEGPCCAATASNVRHYLNPLLGHLRLASVRTMHVQAALRVIVAGRSRSGRLLASSTVDRIRATLRSALAEAVRQGLIEHNPAARVRLPRPDRTRPVVWTPTREAAWRDTGDRPKVAVWSRQHLATFLGHVRNDPHFGLWWLVSLTGLRRGELAAILPADGPEPARIKSYIDVSISSLCCTIPTCPGLAQLSSVS